MAKSFLPLVAAGMLIGMTGCSENSAPPSVENNAELMADALEQKADNLEAMAGAAANDSVADMLEGAADNLDDRADNVRDLASEAAEQR